MACRPLRIALVGCGQIADAHLQELRRLPSAIVAAVCDLHLDLARQAAVRFDVPLVFDDVSTLLDRVRPDLVHVTTPPHTHKSVAVQCLSAGAHVYVEKPFAVDAAEAEAIVRTAERAGLAVCLGHDQLFDPAWQDCRQQIASGGIGQIVHVEAIQGYDLSGPFGRMLQDDPLHWVHRLPGGLFQNVLSHALARVLDVLPDPSPAITARWFTAGSATFPTELRLQVFGERCTGAVTFSTRVRPLRRVTRIFGTHGTMEVDLDAGTVTVDRSASWPGALGRLEITWRRLDQARRNFSATLRRFGRRDLHYFEGMHALFRQFHDFIDNRGPMPVPHEDALRTTRIMDRIFEACTGGAGSAVAHNLSRPARLALAVSPDPPAVVHGGRP